MAGARIGFVSSYDPATGMASVYYRSRNDTTEMVPVFSPFGATQEIAKDTMVLVEHLEDGSAVAIGAFTGEAPSAAKIQVDGNSMTLTDGSGSVTIAELVQAVAWMHPQGSG